MFTVLPYKGTSTLKQLAYMQQQETLVRIYKLKITKQIEGTLLIGLALGLGCLSVE